MRERTREIGERFCEILQRQIRPRALSLPQAPRAPHFLRSSQLKDRKSAASRAKKRVSLALPPPPGGCEDSRTRAFFFLLSFASNLLLVSLRGPSQCCSPCPFRFAPSPSPRAMIIPPSKDRMRESTTSASARLGGNWRLEVGGKRVGVGSRASRRESRG